MTTAELRALLANATPVPWRMVTDDPAQKLAIAAVNALPALLDVVERVAKLPEWSVQIRLVNEGNESGDQFVSMEDRGPCLVCDGDDHAPDCAWVAARKIVGEM